MAMTNEIKMIEALENVAKSFDYNMIYFTADRNEVVAIHFEKQEYVEYKANGETVAKIAKEL